MTIYTPNIVISKNYTFMNNFMEGKYFSDLDSAAADDAVVFNGKQNKYVYSLEHSFNYNHSDTQIVLKIVDVDGSFDNTFFNETFYQRLMNNSVNKYLQETQDNKSKVKFSDFQAYVNDYLQSQIKIYLAYGIGDDLATWTDPIACTLVAADIDVANNGLINYTYKFIPQINNFFRPKPEKDKNDPNRDVDFDFGVASVRTEYLMYPSNKADIDYNISDLIQGFIAKVCNVSRNNVIVVTPELNKTFASNPNVNTKTTVVYRNPNSSLPPTQVVKINLNDDNAAAEFYRSTFKLEAVFNKSKIVTKKVGIYKTRNIQDVVIKLNSDLKSTKDKLAKLQKDYQGMQPVNQIQEQREKVYKQLTDKKSEINRLQNSIDPLVKAGLTTANSNVYTRLSQELTKLTREKVDLENILSKLAKEETAVLSAKEEVDTLAEQQTSLEKVLKNPPQESYLDSYKDVSSTAPDQFKLSMVAEADAANNDDKDKTLIPNWMNALTEVFKGISVLYNSGENYIVPQISYETNLKWLKLFKKYNFIADPTQPCVIVGDRQLVLDKIYCNQVPLQSTPNIKSKFDLPTESVVSKAHRAGYLEDVMNLVFRKRNSSSFSEKIYLDELALTEKFDKKVLTTFDGISKSLDIPIFVNNFKNSNIISYSLKNTENYIAAIKFAVRDNRLKYLLDQLDSNIIDKLITDAGLTRNNMTPIKLVSELFEGAEKLIPQGINKYGKVNSEDFNTVKNQIDTADRTGSELKEDFEKAVGNNKYLKFLKNTMLKDTTTNAPSPTGRFYLRPVILTNNYENVSNLNLALQSTLLQYDFIRNIDQRELAAIADFIILLNISNDLTGNNTLSFIPGITLPTSNFILSKLLEYQQRNASELSIKTLPFFNLSDARSIYKPAVVLSKRISTLGDRDKDVRFDFFSGEWRIVGFRHVINTQECYSEFMLNKYMASDETLKGHP